MRVSGDYNALREEKREKKSSGVLQGVGFIDLLSFKIRSLFPKASSNSLVIWKTWPTMLSFCHDTA